MTFVMDHSLLNSRSLLPKPSNKRAQREKCEKPTTGFTRCDHSSLLNFYTNLTKCGEFDGAKKSTTHYIDVRVKVEYVGGEVGQSTNQLQGSEMKPSVGRQSPATPRGRV